MTQITNSFDKSETFGGAAFTIGDETAGDAITVGIQLLDEFGKTLARSMAFMAYLSSDPAGLTPVGIPTSLTAGTDGSVVVLGQVSSIDAVILCITEVTGQIDVVVTGDTGADDVYLNLMRPNGQRLTSALISIAAD